MRLPEAIIVVLLAVSILLICPAASMAGNGSFSEDLFVTRQTSQALPDADLYHRGLSMVRNGLMAYYQVYGQWPGSWQEVVETGIFQVSVLGPNDEVIDPDDQSWDFYWDVVYDPSSIDSEGRTQLLFAYDDDGTVTDRMRVYPTKTYTELIELTIEFVESQQGQGASARITELQGYQTDPAALHLFAIIGLMNNGVHEFDRVYGRPPHTIDEFVQSGFSPVDYNSLNPWTGEQFRFDGSPYDVHYWYNDDNSAEGSYLAQFIHVMPGDEYPTLRLDY